MKYLKLIVLFLIINSYLKAQQEIHIKGKVIDAVSKVPLEGISVRYENYSASITDSLGLFEIRLPKLNVLISAKGDNYQEKFVYVENNNDLIISLFEESFSSFNEFVNKFYKKDPIILETNSIVSINSYEKLYKNSSKSIENILKGQSSGITLIPNSGLDNSRFSFLIRGYSSLYLSNDPLIVVDGMIYDNQSYKNSIFSGYTYNPLLYIDIYDIENVTIQKDANALYGARGGNGIVFINTHVAQKMATSINFITYGGINYKPNFRYKLLKSNDYKLYLAELLQSRGLAPDEINSLPFLTNDITDPLYYKFNNETDWPSLIFNEKSYNKSVGLKITGGDNIALYSLTLRYFDNSGITKNTGLSRYNLRFNTDVNVSRKVTINAKIGFSYIQGSLVNDGYDLKRSPLFISMIKAPFLYPNVISEDGKISPNLENADIFNIPNPVAFINKQIVSTIGNRVFGSANVNYKFSENLILSNLIGFSFDKKRDNLFLPHLGYAKDTIDIGVIENEMAQQINKSFLINNDFRLSYTRNLAHIHKINLLVGSRFNIINSEEDWGKAYNSPNDEARSLASGNLNFSRTGGFIGKVRYITNYLNLFYSLRSKYLFNGNISLDGSSKFGEKAEGINLFGGNFGIFYSLSSAWLISSENFFNVKFINLLKIRASYGIVGNDSYDEYAAKKYYISQNLFGSQGLVQGNLWNPYLQYEKISKLNLGLDIALFDDKVKLNLDLYRHHNMNLFNEIVPEVYSGFDKYFKNEGELLIKGIEASLNSRIINSSNFRIDLFAKVDKYKSEILKFPEEKRITKILDAEILTANGNPAGVFYGYKTNGVYSTNQEAENDGLKVLMPNTDLIPLKAGDVRFVDVDGNKIIDENDKQIIGDPNPDLTGCFGFSIKIKRFSIDALMYYSIGNDIYNFTRHQLESMKNYNNQTIAIINRWRYEGQVTDIPRAVWGDPIGNSRFSDRWIEDGSFLKLKNVTMSYDFNPKKLLRNLSIFITGENLLTFTKYLGFDPEFGFSNNILWRGIDQGFVPQFRSIYFGFKLGL